MIQRSLSVRNTYVRRCSLNRYLKYTPLIGLEETEEKGIKTRFWLHDHILDVTQNVLSQTISFFFFVAVHYT